MDLNDLSVGRRLISNASTMNIATARSPEDTASYLRTLPAIRERCGRVYDLAKKGQLQYFDYHPERESDVTAFCIEIIKVSTFI